MFLDYYGCSKLNLETAAAFVEGVALGCRDAGCALVSNKTLHSFSRNISSPIMYSQDNPHPPKKNSWIGDS